MECYLIIGDIMAQCALMHFSNLADNEEAKTIPVVAAIYTALISCKNVTCPSSEHLALMAA